MTAGSEATGPWPPPEVVFDRVRVPTLSGGVSPEASFTVAAGSHLEIIGRPGIGKGRLLECAAGLHLPIGGRILVGGVDVATLGYAALQAHRVRTGYVFPKDALLDNHTLLDNVALPLRYHFDAGEDEVARRVSAVLDELGIAGAGGQRPATCTAGTVKRALVARALLLEPSLLLMEEVTAGLSFREQGAVAAAIRRRRESRGMTVLQTNHDQQAAGIPAERVIDFETHGEGPRTPDRTTGEVAP